MKANTTALPNRINQDRPEAGARMSKRRRCWATFTEDQAHEHMTAKGIRFAVIPLEVVQP